MKKRTIALLMAAVMLLGVVTGGTVAWLSAKSKVVTNTFTVGNVAVTLDESKLNDDKKSLDKDTRVQGNEYQLIPGTTYPKDPVVTVENNVDCYLFVQFDESASSYLEYTSALNGEGWKKLATELTTEDGDVWYREVSANADDKSWELLENNTVKVKDVIVKGEVKDGEILMPSTNQTLIWKAYAVQKDNLDVAKAWDLVDPTP